jgi:hypothetical protein
VSANVVPAVYCAFRIATWRRGLSAKDAAF